MRDKKLRKYLGIKENDKRVLLNLSSRFGNHKDGKIGRIENKIDALIKYLGCEFNGVNIIKESERESTSGIATQGDKATVERRY